MKRKIVFFVIFIIIFLTLIINISGISASTKVTLIGSSVENPQDNSAAKESIIKYILNNSYSTTLDFTGQNVNWDLSLKTENAIKEDGSEKKQTKLTIKPKKLNEFVRYKIITNNLTEKIYYWYELAKPVVITETKSIPKLKDPLLINIVTNDLNEIIPLKLHPPETKVGIDKAVEIMVDKYFSTFKEFPKVNFSYEVDIEEKNWLISYDDNDGIGGKSVLVIDSTTGDSDGIKTDE